MFVSRRAKLCKNFAFNKWVMQKLCKVSVRPTTFLNLNSNCEKIFRLLPLTFGTLLYYKPHSNVCLFARPHPPSLLGHHPPRWTTPAPSESPDPQHPHPLEPPPPSDQVQVWCVCVYVCEGRGGVVQLGFSWWRGLVQVGAKSVIKKRL